MNTEFTLAYQHYHADHRFTNPLLCHSLTFSATALVPGPQCWSCLASAIPAEALQDAFSSLKVTKEADVSKKGEAIATDNAGERMEENDPISAFLT